MVRRIEDGWRRKKVEDDGRKFLGSISYIGWKTRKLLACFRKYGMDISIKRSLTVFDQI